MLYRQPHFPITGENAFKHSSGWHTNAIIKNPDVYHAIVPQTVWSEVSLIFGPNSWSNHLNMILEKSWIILNGEKFKFMEYIKNNYSHRRKWFTDDEIVQIYREFEQKI
jgi:2-isopropylmalate synthase